MLDFADVIALNKFDKRGGIDALRDVKKQYQRNHQLFDKDAESMPVFGTIASQFNDPVVNQLYRTIIDKVNEKTKTKWESSMKLTGEIPEKIFIIPPHRTRYLSEIADTVRSYNKWAEDQAEVAQKLYSLKCSIEELNKHKKTVEAASLESLYKELELNLDGQNKKILDTWEIRQYQYKQEFYVFKVRDKELKIKTHTETLSHLKYPKYQRLNTKRGAIF